MSFFIRSLLVSWVFLLASCTKVNSGVVGMFNLDTDLKLIITANNSLNPDEKRDPSPLFIRLYELNSDQVFGKTDFYGLFENDAKTLDKDLIVKRELTRILPATTREETFLLNSKTRFVGLYAEFYDYKNSGFKVVFPVTPKNVVKNTVRIEINGNQMTVQTKK